MAKKKQQPKEAPTPRRKRRSIDEQIADLQAKISAIKEREARKQAKADPALRHVSAALRSIDKALEASSDSHIKKTLGEARSVLSKLVGGEGGENGRVRRTAAEMGDLAEALLAYLHSNPGQRGEQIAEALDSDTGTIRPVMKKLIEAGKVTTEGQRRGMTYTAV